MEPKNIERLFQEKLKDLEMSPDPAVWDKIESSLKQQKQKRKYIFWYRSVGITAIIVLGLFIYSNNYEIQKPNTKIKETPITDTKIYPKKIENRFNNIKIDATQIATTIPKEKKSQPKENRKTASIPFSVIAQTEIILPIEPKTIDNIQSKLIFNEIRKSNRSVIVYKNRPLIKKSEKTLNNKLDLADVIEKEEEEEEEEEKHSWAIAPTISQLFSNTLSDNSSIDTALNKATKKGSNSTSFGLRIGYQTSKRWQFQTGIHQLKLAQTTEDIRFISTPTNSLFESSSNDRPSITDAVSNESISGTDIDKSEGSINHTYGYIEIPLEVKYLLFTSNRFNTHVISGISSLFLTTNNLQIETENNSFSAGKATNLNNINFTLNFGANAEYHFDKKWYLDIAPMIKFQTNTFETKSNKPYFFGIYTGINYKF